jgi:predicted nucleic acid-binding protein
VRWTRLQAQRLYLDANVVIYAFEGSNRWEAALRELLAAIDDGELTAVTSELTLCEVLVVPFREGASDVVSQYERVLSGEGALNVPPVDRAILRSAALLRAELRLKLADSIHVATAQAYGCDFFLSNDGELRFPAGLSEFKLDELL